MDLKTYFFSLTVEDRQVLATKCDTSPKHLQNIAYGYKKPGAALAVAIEQATKKKVTRQEMLPTNFKAIWPELKAA